MEKKEVTDQEIILTMSHEEALMIVSIFADVAFGSPFDATFVTRNGFTQKRIGEVAKDLRQILNECDITE